jgi:hypothetical protein
MKKTILFSASLLLLSLVTHAQGKSPELKKEVIESKAESAPNAEVAALSRPTNDNKGPKSNAAKKGAKESGEVYGMEYSDVVIDNWTDHNIDIYINGNYRGSIAPWDKRVTWAIPGNNKLYAKAVFRDGSYKYWGPRNTTTGYNYTWKLNP